jgi:hypothetical protein
VDPEELSARYENGTPCKQGHECHCITINGLRVAWGICCARFTVSVENMKEEDYHDRAPWAVPEDCTCSLGRKLKPRKRRAS